MIRDLVKWVVPGLVTVLGGTTLCVAMTSSDMATDLATRSQAALAAPTYAWADIKFDGRDVRLSGTATAVEDREDAVRLLANLSGVRSVDADVQLAPLAQPFAITASVDKGVIALSGAVPSALAQDVLEQRAGGHQAGLALRSGLADRRSWLAAAEYAVEQLKYFDKATITVSNDQVSVAGRAKSERDFNDLQVVLRAGAPLGSTLAAVDITPALVSPYNWSASFDGKQITVSGFVPTDAMAERYRVADLSGAAISTGLALGSGAPDGFADLSTLLLEQLSRLESGSASIIDGTSSLRGAPASEGIARSVVEHLAQAGSIVVLDPPRISDYWVSATRQANGAIVFDGYVPDEATRTAFGAFAGADVSYLKLGRGQPARYQSGVEFGLTLLGRMSDGRIALRGDTLSVSGTARSGADYTALQTALLEDIPQGIAVGESRIQAPRATSYNWSATKAADGTISLAGNVPDQQTQAALIAAAGANSASTMTFASGEPLGFAASTATALDLLMRLSSGTVSFDGAAWVLTGSASSANKTQLDAEFLSRKLAASGWSMAVATAEAPNAPAAPVETAQAESPVAIEPPPANAEPAVVVETPAAVAAEPAPVDPDYAFSASRDAAGAVMLSGQVPSDAILQQLGSASGGDTAAVTIVDGAPSDFAKNAEIGLKLLASLSEGRLDFANGKWSIVGEAADDNARASALDLLAGVDDSTAWTNAITVPQPEVAVAAAPTPAQAPTTTANIEACIAPLSEFSARNAILFQSGAAMITTSSEPALDELASDLAACPDAIVYIEGHTDSDGDEALNLALSVARAEAVVNALIARGVTAARLYAAGYGESSPIAPNDTPAGKQQNRRIVVTVKPEHY